MTANDIFVINGFYASMRSKYTASAASIYYYVVQWDAAALSWAEFRASVLGATDPEKAQSGSMREQVCARWQELGLAAKPDVGDNGVHGSASGGVGHAARVAEEFAPSRLHELDGEGRGVITVHGDLALFNLYVPSLGKTAG